MDEITNAAEMQQIEETCCENSSVVAVLPEKKEWYQTVSLEDAKAFIRANLGTAARSFIAIGFYLKHIRDNKLFLEEGHATIWEFAQEEFCISKSTASRYMSMNDRFSKDGNSPLIDERYKGFDKSKLQEMLSLTDEQLEQVTPDMKVKQIREMGKSREVPYYEMEGQMEFEVDFPEILPDPEANLPVQSQTFTMDVSDMFAGDPIEPAGDPMIQEPVAISQQQEDIGLCLHRPDFPCKLSESAKRTPGDGTDCQDSCCWDCVNHGKCRLECYASANRPEPELPKEQQKPENAAEIAAEPEEKQDPMSDHSFRERHCNALARKMIQCWKPWFEQDFQNRVLNVTESEKQIKEKNNRSSNRTWYFPGPDGEMLHVNMFDGYIQFWGYECLGNCEWFYLTAAIQRMWLEMAIEEARNRFELQAKLDDVKQPEPEVIDAEFEEVTEEPQEESVVIKDYDRKILKGMIQKEQEALDMMRDYWEVNQPDTLTKYLMKVAAYQMLLEAKENYREPEILEQSELPVMKNNEQRKEWLKTFHEWPVWFEVPEASEVYYRYDLPDGYSLVICEYHEWLEWREKYGYDESPDIVRTREYLLKPGYHYLHDCQSNQTAMIEKLKEIQKKG